MAIAIRHTARNTATIDGTVQDRGRQLGAIVAVEANLVAVTPGSSNRAVEALGLPKITVSTRPTDPNHYRVHTPAYPFLDIELASGCFIAMRLSMID